MYGRKLLHSVTISNKNHWNIKGSAVVDEPDPYFFN